MSTRETNAAATVEPVDSLGKPMLETAQDLGRPLTRRRSKGLNHKKQFSLLVVRGDGVRVLRLSFPKRLPTTILVLLGLFASGFGIVVGDWWHVRQRIRDSASLYQQIDEQRSTIDKFNRRVTELRQEITGWRDLHGHIWEAFGPDVAPKGGGTGIGGRATPNERPTGRLSATVQLDLLAENVIEEGESLRALDRLITRARKALAALPSRWPVRGAVNSEFGNRLSPWTKSPESHSGLDIAADRGTSVKSPAAGTVIHAGPHLEYGMTVIVDHGQDVRSLYGHLSKISVKPGQTVERGTELALTGNTGRSSGPHLHYEVMVRGQAVNPRAYLWD